VVYGWLNVYVEFSRRMTRQSSICTWIGAFQEALASVADILPSSKLERPHIDHAQSLAYGGPLPCEQCV
jgi:hypothetical protein